MHAEFWLGGREGLGALESLGGGVGGGGRMDLHG